MKTEDSIAKNICSQQLSLRRGANERVEGVYSRLGLGPTNMTENERVCNKAEDSIAKSIALFGGTFDPIHIAHLNLAKNIQSTFNFQRFLFLPCKLPTHKNNNITASQHRVAMIQVALQAYPIQNVDICLSEINRSAPSYTVDTMQTLRQQYPDVALTFILGFDMFATIHTWHRYKELLCLCNFLVLKRQDQTKPLPQIVSNLLETYQTQDQVKLLNDAFGNIYVFDAGQYTISSTSIRADINGSIIKKIVPESVAEYIKKYKLYI